MRVLRAKDGTPTGFLLSSDEPVRIEVNGWDPSKTPEIIAHVYKGEKIEIDQDPIGCFDGSLEPHEMTNWEILSTVKS